MVSYYISWLSNWLAIHITSVQILHLILVYAKIQVSKMALINKRQTIKTAEVLIASDTQVCSTLSHWYNQLNIQLGSGRSPFNQVKKLLSALPVSSQHNITRITYIKRHKTHRFLFVLCTSFDLRLLIMSRWTIKASFIQCMTNQTKMSV